MARVCACPVCGATAPSTDALAAHLVESAEQSDGRHVMWLNRNVTRRRMTADELTPLLAAALAGDAPTDDRVKR